MAQPVHGFLLWFVMAVWSAVSWAGSPPAGMVSWGEESYRLGPGESTTVTVDDEQIPVRRWVLLVESNLALSHLNVRRRADGRLVYDQRDERRHEVAVPWGQGEEVSAVLTAGRRGGVFQVSVWGPPPEDYLRSYSYEVNRALEAFDRGEPTAARNHLQAALRLDPDDAVAAVLLAGSNESGLPAVSSPDLVDLADAPDDSTTRERVAEVRRHAARLRGAGRQFAAAEVLQGELARRQAASLRVELLVDLVEVMIDLENLPQARQALGAAVQLGLAEERVAALQAAVTANTNQVPH